MKRILLAWELGAGYGHIAVLREVARALRALGHDCLFAVRELGPAEEFLSTRAENLGPVFQAPRAPVNAQRPVKLQLSYASLLNNTGFDDPVALAARLRAWRQLLQTLRIDAVLANHAPSALIAAASLNLPRGCFGSSFTIPPVTSPFPSFQPQLSVERQVLVHNEAQVLAKLNQALERLHLPPWPSLQQIFAGSQQRVFGYPELDSYAAARPELFAGLADHSHGEPPAWPQAPGPRLFAYLRPFRHLEPLLRALHASRVSALLRVADVPPEKLRPFLRPGLAITTQPVHLRLAAEQCDGMIHYAPEGTLCEMLLAGKPGLLLPTDVEKGLLAGRAQQLGAALVSDGRDELALGRLLQQLVEEPGLRRSAETFAARYRSQDRTAVVPAYAADFSRSL